MSRVKQNQRKTLDEIQIGSGKHNPKIPSGKQNQ